MEARKQSGSTEIVLDSTRPKKPRPEPGWGRGGSGSYVLEMEDRLEPKVIQDRQTDVCAGFRIYKQLMRSEPINLQCRTQCFVVFKTEQ